MSIWRQLTRGLRTLTKRRVADRDIADEVESYLAQAAEELEASGMSPGEARRTVRQRLGNATTVGEQVRSYGWENVISARVSDVIFAARRLLRNPAFTTVCVLTLANSLNAKRSEGLRDFGPALNLAQKASERGMRHHPVKAKA